jgi:hypothetical protein
MALAATVIVKEKRINKLRVAKAQIKTGSTYAQIDIRHTEFPRYLHYSQGVAFASKSYTTLRGPILNRAIPAQTHSL